MSPKFINLMYVRKHTTERKPYTNRKLFCPLTQLTTSVLISGYPGNTLKEYFIIVRAWMRRGGEDKESGGTYIIYAVYGSFFCKISLNTG